MKQLNNLSPAITFALAACISLLSACGSESYQSDPLNAELIERVCIDNNKNSRCEQAELESYAVENNSQAENNTKSLTLNLTAKLTTDPITTRIIETINSLTGQQYWVLKAPANSLQTDALTTLLWHELHHNPTVSSTAEAKIYLTDKLGIIWPQNDQLPSAYQQQESTAREHITYAQAHSSVDNAISATIEAMILNRSIDTPADINLINQQVSPLALTGHFVSEKELLNWSFSSDRQEITLAHPDRKLSLLKLSNTGKLFLDKEFNLTSGTEAVLSELNTTEGSKSVTANINSKAIINYKLISAAKMIDDQGKTIDAFASATTSTPAPAPAPAPNLPTDPDSGSQPNEPRNLAPTGEIQAVRLNKDNRTGLFLTLDNDQQSLAPRACNNNISSHGIFKFDHYLSSNNKTPVIAACSQLNLEKIEISQDGNLILAWDQVARRLYLIDTNTMREATNYYLQLNSNVLIMKLNPNADYAFITEEEGRKSYLVRLADMQVMTDFSFAGNSVTDIQWLDSGNKLILAEENEWQLWDTRLTYNPQLLNQGDMAGVGQVIFNNDASLYARIKENKLSIYRQQDNQLMSQYSDIESVKWNGNQLIVQQNNQLKLLALQVHTSHPIQLVNFALTASFIANNNTALNQISSALNLPTNAAELTQLALPRLKELAIIWSVSSGLEDNINYSGSEQGSITQTTSPQNGVITATINSYFRGEAIRWTRDFEITIKAK